MRCAVGLGLSDEIRAVIAAPGGDSGWPPGPGLSSGLTSRLGREGRRMRSVEAGVVHTYF